MPDRIQYRNDSVFFPNGPTRFYIALQDTGTLPCAVNTRQSPVCTRQKGSRQPSVGKDLCRGFFCRTHDKTFAMYITRHSAKKRRSRQLTVAQVLCCVSSALTHGKQDNFAVGQRSQHTAKNGTFAVCYGFSTRQRYFPGRSVVIICRVLWSLLYVVVLWCARSLPWAVLPGARQIFSLPCAIILLCVCSRSTRQTLYLLCVRCFAHGKCFGKRMVSGSVGWLV